jgi:hypothetical protein
MGAGGSRNMAHITMTAPPIANAAPDVGSGAAHTSMRTTSPITNAATDVLTVVFGFLDIGDCAIAKLVCKRWRSLNTLKDGTPLHLWHFGGSTQQLEWALANGCRPAVPKYRIVGIRAIGADNQPVVQFAYNRARAAGMDFRGIERFCIRAATCNRLQILQWLLSNGAPMSWMVVQAASSVEMLEWIKKNSTPQVWVDLRPSLLVRSRSLAVIQWHVKNGSLQLKSDQLLCAAWSGSAEKLSWILTTGRAQPQPFRYKVGKLALLVVEGLSRTTECLDYLRDVEKYRAAGCPYAIAACRTAAARGKLAMLQWLHREGAEWRADEYLNTVIAEQRKYQRAIARDAGPYISCRARRLRLEKLQQVADWIITASAAGPGTARAPVP